jgi:hypothetical protein
MDEHWLTDSARVALLEEEAVPGVQRLKKARARRSSGCRSKTSRAQLAASGGWVMAEIRRPSSA